MATLPDPSCITWSCEELLLEHDDDHELHAFDIAYPAIQTENQFASTRPTEH